MFLTVSYLSANIYEINDSILGSVKYTFRNRLRCTDSSIAAFYYTYFPSFLTYNMGIYYAKSLIVSSNSHDTSERIKKIEKTIKYNMAYIIADLSDHFNLTNEEVELIFNYDCIIKEFHNIRLSKKTY